MDCTFVARHPTLALAFWDHDHAIMRQNIFTCCLHSWWIFWGEMACFWKNAGVTTQVMLVKSQKGCWSENCGICPKQKWHCHIVVVMRDPMECKQTPPAVLKLVSYSQWCDIFLCLHFANKSFPFCEMTRRSGISGGGFGSIQNGTSQAKVGVQKIMSEYGCKHLCGRFLASGSTLVGLLSFICFGHPNIWLVWCWRMLRDISRIPILAIGIWHFHPCGPMHGTKVGTLMDWWVL